MILKGRTKEIFRGKVDRKMEEIRENLAAEVVSPDKKQAQEEKAPLASIRAKFYMSNKEVLVTEFFMALKDGRELDARVSEYRQQLCHIKLGKDSSIQHCGAIATVGNLCVDMRECIGFEVDGQISKVMAGDGKQAGKNVIPAVSVTAAAKVLREELHTKEYRRKSLGLQK
ncbi:MAG: hypothetical protein HFG79_05430 [Lachnospiraceae bacterium]|jgi:hypothetical protein|nr:hypothetical protein [Lachnospiraceae bacterium]